MKEIRELRFCGYLAPGFFPSPLFFWCQKSAARVEGGRFNFTPERKGKKNCISSPAATEGEDESLKGEVQRRIGPPKKKSLYDNCVVAVASKEGGGRRNVFGLPEMCP